MQAGQTLSHYQIVEKLGEGGMGVVYRARDTNLDRFVAVKVLPPDKVADPERKRRFAQEAKTASALNHPNIITIHDIGSARGADFIVMEFVKGKTLDQLIAKKGMALGEALKYAVQIADALAAAAAAGVIHRDLKPGNVMVTESGLVKVLDFGLAKLTEPSSAGDPELTASVAAATEEGAILGTVSYMSPEQAEGRKLDGRSDIFSFGALLYEMLTGQKAFQGETKMSTLVAILHKEPKPLSEVSGGLPREMERIITRCLRKDLDRRWQSMADLRVALRDLKEESESGVGFFPEVAVPPRKARRVPRWVWIALTAVAVGLGGVAVWRLPRAASPTPASVRVVPLTTLEGSETHPSFSPDGSHVAFAWNGGRGNDDIYLKMVGAGTPVRLTSDPARDAHPEWSPDGRWIAYLHDLGSHRWEVRLIAPFGGAERRLAETQADQVTGTSFLAWFPDGKQLVVRDEGGKGQPPGLFAMSAETGERVRLTTSPDDDSGPALSPDGRTLAFGRGGAGAHTGLYLLSLSEDHKPQGEPRRLVASARPPSSAAWTPDGREIVYSFFREHGYQMWRVAASGSAKPERLEWAGNDARHPTFSRGLQGGAWRFAFVQRFLQVNLVRYAIPSTESKAVGEPVVASTRTEQDPDYAPDGKKIAYASDQSGSYEIWVSEADGSNPQQLTSMPGLNPSGPRWSPDGRQIAFYTLSPNGPEIYTVSARGGAPQLVQNSLAAHYPLGWSRDGKSLYCTVQVPEKAGLWKVPVNGGEPLRLTRRSVGGDDSNQIACAGESPDGKDLYFGDVKIWKAPLDGGPETEITAIRSEASMVARTGIYFVAPDTNSREIHYYSFSTGKIRPVLTVPKPCRRNFAVSPDEQWILWPQLDAQGSDLMLVENLR